jgi:Rod binding domain-containing protein
MNPIALHSPVLPPSLEQPLPDAGAIQDPQALAQEFESLFVSQLIKEMRQSSEEGLFPGDESDTFGGMFDMFMGRHIAQSGGIGLADSIRSALESQQGTPASGPGRN